MLETQSNEEITEHLPPEINSLISDAVLTARVQKIMGASAPKRWYVKIVDHSLFALVLGILLSFFFGTILVKWWEDARLEATRQIERERREKDALIAAFNDFLGTLSEQRAHSLMVDHAMQHEAPINELTTLLHNEQQIFAKSQQKAAVLSFTIRELVPSQTYARLHDAIDNGLRKPLDEAIKVHAFIYYQKANRPKSDEWKNASALTSRISDCGAAVSHAVWYNTIAPANTDPDFIRRKEESMTRMEEGCKR
jgi:hypothetical protein